MNKLIVTTTFITLLTSWQAYGQVSSNKDVSEYIYKEKDFTNAVKLQGINKITARASSLEINKNEQAKFGNLEIELLKCWKAPPEEKPENKALIKVWEQIPGEDKKEIFSGWMFASSPAISALEHPVYDIIVTECSEQSEEPDNVEETSGNV